VQRAAGLLAFLMAIVAVSAGHDVITTKLTFARDIAPIFARRCIACHDEKSSVPLGTYEAARPWAVDIKEQVLSRAMPPWGAVKGFGRFNPDYGLTQEEILTIAAWVVGGAPAGDLKPVAKPASPMRNDKLSEIRDAVTVTNRAVLAKPLRVAGIRPIPERTVDSVRIVAERPDGRVDPLVWLYRYDPRSKQLFRFEQALDLPAGAVVVASGPLRFALEVVGR
jgi:hypothetical protein